jgi:hypothetical protein
VNSASFGHFFAKPKSAIYTHVCTQEQRICRRGFVAEEEMYAVVGVVKCVYVCVYVCV